MDRRKFSKSIVLAGAAASILPFQSFAFNKNRDKYGGWKELRFDSTGYFRLEKKNGKWWFVSPDGNAFLSLGINHISPNYVSGSKWYNILGIKDGHTPEEFLNAACRKIQTDMDGFGFNTLGTHNSTDWWERNGEWISPYIQQLHFVRIAAYMQPPKENFPDVFTLDFENHCNEYAAKHVAKRQEDPWMLGYSMCPVPVLTEMDAERWEGGWVGTYLPTWPRVLRNLGGNSPGKQVYVKCVQKRYENNIDAFNKTYKTGFTSFTELLKTENWKDRLETIIPQKQQDDDLAFLLIILERYFKIATEAIHKYDRNHLILGNKLGANTDIPDSVIKLSAMYMDMVFYGAYGTYEFQNRWMDRWSKITDKAFMSGDMDFAVRSKAAPFATGPHCENQEQRALETKDFLEKAFSRDDFVGMHWCGWIDRSTDVPVKRGVQHTGVIDENGNYYKPMQKVFNSFTQRMYKIH